MLSSPLRNAILAMLFMLLAGFVGAPVRESEACGNREQGLYLMLEKEDMVRTSDLSFFDALRYAGLIPRESFVAADPSGYDECVLSADARTPFERTQDADLGDLSDAIRERGWSMAPVARYAAVRQLLVAGRQNRQDSNLHRTSYYNTSWTYDIPGADEDWTIPDGLPDEFGLYLEGAVEYYFGRRPQAIAKWKQLLALPPKERQYRTVWAQYMLGRMHAGSKPEVEGHWYRACEQSIAAGYHDSLLLGASILGWRAKSLVEAEDFAGATTLYRQAAAMGDPAASGSLAEMLHLEIGAAVEREDIEHSIPLIMELVRGESGGAESTLAYTHLAALSRLSDAVLKRLIRHPEARELMTAFHAARSSAERRTRWSWEDPIPPDSHSARWLTLLEEAKAPSVKAAGLQAWIAYTHGEYDLAMRWAKRAPKDPLVQYLHAKEALRAGDFSLATERYEVLCAQLTDTAGFNGWNDWGYWFDDEAFDWYDEHGYPRLVDTMRFEMEPDPTEIWSEYGALLMHEGRFVEALDAFALYGQQMRDAGYVAERILTTEELIQWVDVHAPAVLTRPKHWAGEIRYRMRWLLARRLMREGRRTEAVPYFPFEWREVARRMDLALRTGRDPLGTSRSRAEALWQAAQIARHQGMELYGTEGYPDNALEAGNFGDRNLLRNRAGLGERDPEENQWSAEYFAPQPVYPPVSSFELSRLKPQTEWPTHRYHYRFLASKLAWEAASFLPDHTYQQAMVLHNGGHFIKGRDPQAADRFYKAMVNQNRGIPFVEEADRERWFLDVVRITWDPLPATHGNLLYSLP